MSEKESPPPAAQNEFSNQISHIEKTDNTSPTGLDETEDPDFKFGVTRAIAFVVRIFPSTCLLLKTR